jgi:hypothetical protein
MSGGYFREWDSSSGGVLSLSRARSLPPSSKMGSERRQGAGLCPAAEGIGRGGNPAIAFEDGHDGGQDECAEAIDPILSEGY